MEPIRYPAAARAQWRQPETLQKRYELRAEDRLFATLEFNSNWGSRALAITAGGAWTFKRVGFFRTRVTVRREGEEADLAVYSPGWNGMEGRLAFAAGSAPAPLFLWKSANFWATQYGFYTPAGDAVVVFKPGVDHAEIVDIFKFQARVELDSASAAYAETPLLAALGWYLMILQMEDAAAVASASSAAASSS